MIAKREIVLHVVHDGVQPGGPLDEVLRFGLQDAKGEVHPGVAGPEGVRHFAFTLDVREGKAGDPVLHGAFAHGPPAGRFIYLSWKREGVHEHPWGWRIKLPLGGIGWDTICAAEAPGMCLSTNAIGRRPHSSAPVVWRVEPLRVG